MCLPQGPSIPNVRKDELRTNMLENWIVFLNILLRLDKQRKNTRSYLACMQSKSRWVNYLKMNWNYKTSWRCYVYAHIQWQWSFLVWIVFTTTPCFQIAFFLKNFFWSFHVEELLRTIYTWKFYECKFLESNFSVSILIWYSISFGNSLHSCWETRPL